MSSTELASADLNRSHDEVDRWAIESTETRETMCLSDRLLMAKIHFDAQDKSDVSSTPTPAVLQRILDAEWCKSDPCWARGSAPEHKHTDSGVLTRSFVYGVAFAVEQMTASHGAALDHPSADRPRPIGPEAAP